MFGGRGAGSAVPANGWAARAIARGDNSPPPSAGDRLGTQGAPRSKIGAQPAFAPQGPRRHCRSPMCRAAGPFSRTCRSLSGRVFFCGGPRRRPTSGGFGAYAPSGPSGRAAGSSRPPGCPVFAMIQACPGRALGVGAIASPRAPARTEGRPARVKGEPPRAKGGAGFRGERAGWRVADLCSRRKSLRAPQEGAAGGWRRLYCAVFAARRFRKHARCPARRAAWPVLFRALLMLRRPREQRAGPTQCYLAGRGVARPKSDTNQSFHSYLYRHSRAGPRFSHTSEFEQSLNIV